LSIYFEDLGEPVAESIDAADTVCFFKFGTAFATASVFMFVVGIGCKHGFDIAQYTLEKPRQSTVKLNTQYVNCWEDHTHFSVLYRVLEGIDNTLDIHQKATPQDVLLERLHDYHGPPYIVILDEADQLDTIDVLYELLRTRRLPFILITNDNDTLIPRFDERLASRLRTATRIQFDPYSFDALTSILGDRVRGGSTPTPTDRQLEAIADAAAGGARVAIGTLRQAAQRATSQSTDTITDTHIEAAVPDAKVEIKQENLSRLTRHQRVLYDIIHDHTTIDPRPLYEQYSAEVGSSKTRRMVRNYLSKLEHHNLISAIGNDRGRKYSIVD
jgi:Cdc6-like AAA superfamily ATPase